MLNSSKYSVTPLGYSGNERKALPTYRQRLFHRPLCQHTSDIQIKLCHSLSWRVFLSASSWGFPATFKTISAVTKLHFSAPDRSWADGNLPLWIQPVGNDCLSCTWLMDTHRIKISNGPSVPSIALQTSFQCPQYLTVALQLISQKNEFCAVLLCTSAQPPPKSLGNCWPISNKFGSKAPTCATNKLCENNVNERSSSLPGCRSLLTHQRTHRAVLLMEPVPWAGGRKEKKKFTKSLFVNGSQESHLILLFSTGIENISSLYPTHSFTIFSNHDQNDLFYNYTVTWQSLWIPSRHIWYW